MTISTPHAVRALVVALAVVALAVVALAVTGDDGDDRILVARFAAATNLVDGANVTAGGRPVGRVDAVRLADGQAEVEMRIADDAVWPLPEGTTAQVRFGGTVSYSNRYVELRPGPAGGAALRSGTRLPSADALSAVEIDEVLDIFDRPAREDLGRLVDSSARTLGPRGRTLARGLERTGPAASAAADLLAELGDDPDALTILARQGARTAGALRGGADDLVAVAEDAGATFAEVARASDGVAQTLRQAPATFDAARGTLQRLDPTLGRLDAVAADLAPGAEQLRRLTGPAASALRTLDDVAPRLRTTLRTVERAAPGLTGLLDAARPVLDDAEPALEQLQPMLACLRPYAPQIAHFGTNWGGATGHYDAVGHVGYVAVTEQPLPDLTPLTPAQAAATIPGLGYRYLRPPGYNAGDEWFQPQCGVGPEVFDPKADPEVTG